MSRLPISLGTRAGTIRERESGLVGSPGTGRVGSPGAPGLVRTPGSLRAPGLIGTPGTPGTGRVGSPGASRLPGPSSRRDSRDFTGLDLRVLTSNTSFLARFDVMRSYQGYYTRSHQNSEVKRLWAGIVLGWVTSREVPVLHPFSKNPQLS